MDAAAAAAAIDTANAAAANATANAAAATAANPAVDPATAAAIAGAITAALTNMQPPAAQVVQLQAPLPVVVPPQVPVWICTPALTGGTVLDYKDIPADAKIFKENTAKLDTTFSLAKPNVTALITELVIHSEMSSWNQLMALTVNAVNMNFLKSYGRVTLPQLRPRACRKTITSCTFASSPPTPSHRISTQVVFCTPRSFSPRPKPTLRPPSRMLARTSSHWINTWPISRIRT
jgi:hypothetical protein